MPNLRPPDCDNDTSACALPAVCGIAVEAEPRVVLPALLQTPRRRRSSNSSEGGSSDSDDSDEDANQVFADLIRQFGADDAAAMRQINRRIDNNGGGDGGDGGGGGARAGGPGGLAAGTTDPAANAAGRAEEQGAGAGASDADAGAARPLSPGGVARAAAFSSLQPASAYTTAVWAGTDGKSAPASKSYTTVVWRSAAEDDAASAEGREEQQGEAGDEYLEVISGALDLSHNET